MPSLEDLVREIVRAVVREEAAPLVAEVRAVRTALEARPAEVPWVSRAELAEQLGVSVDTIDRRTAAADGIEARHVGRRKLVRLRGCA